MLAKAPKSTGCAGETDLNLIFRSKKKILMFRVSNLWVRPILILSYDNVISHILSWWYNMKIGIKLDARDTDTKHETWIMILFFDRNMRSSSARSSSVPTEVFQDLEGEHLVICCSLRPTLTHFSCRQPRPP